MSNFHIVIAVMMSLYAWFIYHIALKQIKKNNENKEQAKATLNKAYWVMCGPILGVSILSTIGSSDAEPLQIAFVVAVCVGVVHLIVSYRVDQKLKD